MSSVYRCLEACLVPQKKLNTVPAVQSSNATYSSRLFPDKQETYLKSLQLLSLKRKQHQGTEKSREQWKMWCTGDGKIVPWGSSAAVKLVQEFYNAINEKRPEKLNELLSEDCEFQDLIFFVPFGGKQTIIEFFSQVMDAMGPNIRVAMTDGVKEGENDTASAIWHLEWSHNKRIYPLPFTAGYHSFNCVPVNGKLVIRKITGVEGFPVTPGDVVLKLLKAISTVFDSFPAATEGLLQNSHTSHEGLGMPLDMLGARKQSFG